jgi:glycosyltransferase involved in cell wall biosynthesis
LAECDVLAHPSLHDSGGWVCLEAMAAGRPVVCLDLGGPGVQVTSETGIKVTPGSPDQVIADMAQAFQRLSTDKDLRTRMCAAGRSHVRECFSWDRKSQAACRIYETAVKGPAA